MNISKDELALYDRQIRLWGVDAQKRLRDGSILIISKRMDNIVQEILKNLALCGIVSIKLFLECEEMAHHLLYSNLESELSEIFPSINLSLSIENGKPIDPSMYDFVIMCGIMDNIKVSDINDQAHNLNISNIWCFEHGSHYHLFNDFGNFTYGSDHEMKSLSFPSLKQIMQDKSLETHKSPLVTNFYSVIHGKSHTTMTLPDRLSEISGSAILGALVSQEVIKRFSKKDQPINNLLSFDSRNLKNSLTRIVTIS